MFAPSFDRWQWLTSASLRKHCKYKRVARRYHGAVITVIKSVYGWAALSLRAKCARLLSIGTPIHSLSLSVCIADASRPLWPLFGPCLVCVWSRGTRARFRVCAHDEQTEPAFYATTQHCINDHV